MRANYTVAQLAEHWQCSEAHLYNLIKRGELEAFKVGRSTRIAVDEVARIENGLAETVGNQRWTFTNPWSRA